MSRLPLQAPGFWYQPWARKTAEGAAGHGGTRHGALHPGRGKLAYRSSGADTIVTHVMLQARNCILYAKKGTISS